MSRYSAITAAFVSALLALVTLHPASAATKKSSTKKKTTTSAAAKKKAASKDAGAGSAASESDKGSGASLDLPLPAKVPNAHEGGASPDTKEGSTDKSAAPTDRKDGSSKKGGSATEMKKEEKPASDGKASEKTGTAPTTNREHPPNATVEPDAIAEFATQPTRIQRMIRDAIDLTRLNLTYTFGSADPDNGGMDCSGTIYYLLHAHGFNDVARDSSGQYLWTRKGGAFFPVVSQSAESVEFDDLLPGDLMFWTGTYESGRDIPISHVMLYLGREKATGKRIMFGASDGRSYNGVQRWGVSVFDFKMPKADPANPEKAPAHFIGYARVPGLRSGGAAAGEPAATTASKDAPKPSAKKTTASSRKKKGKSRKAN